MKTNIKGILLFFLLGYIGVALSEVTPVIVDVSPSKPSLSVRWIQNGGQRGYGDRVEYDRLDIGHRSWFSSEYCTWINCSRTDYAVGYSGIKPIPIDSSIRTCGSSSNYTKEIGAPPWNAASEGAC